LNITPTAALERLMAGNRRYVADQLERPNQDPARRAEVVRGQYPFAAVLSCSDSRVPSEIIFDCGLGDLFIVRTAGHVLGPAALGSLEYSAESLAVPLIMVVGHSQCGAVTAVVADGAELPGAMRSLGLFIQPALERAKARPGNLLANTIHSNTARTVDLLRQSEPFLRPRVEAGRLLIVGAYYDLETGVVTLSDRQELTDG
jgi:carbonic anhydrase